MTIRTPKLQHRLWVISMIYCQNMKKRTYQCLPKVQLLMTFLIRHQGRWWSSLKIQRPVEDCSNEEIKALMCLMSSCSFSYAFIWFTSASFFVFILAERSHVRYQQLKNSRQHYGACISNSHSFRFVPLVARCSYNIHPTNQFNQDDTPPFGAISFSHDHQSSWWQKFVCVCGALHCWFDTHHDLIAWVLSLEPITP